MEITLRDKGKKFITFEKEGIFFRRIMTLAVGGFRADITWEDGAKRSFDASREEPEILPYDLREWKADVIRKWRNVLNGTTTALYYRSELFGEMSMKIEKIFLFQRPPYQIIFERVIRRYPGDPVSEVPELYIVKREVQREDFLNLDSFADVLITLFKKKHAVPVRP